MAVVGVGSDVVGVRDYGAPVDLIISLSQFFMVVCE